MVFSTRYREGVLCPPAGPLCREEGLGFSENLLQTIWFHQRLKREQLRTTRGQNVRVLHPGFWNREAGPDFLDAVVQLDDAPAASGDVEIDLAPGGWQAHGHHVNPRFRNVILHVVWERGGGGIEPCLELKPFLDAPLEELFRWSHAESTDLPEALRGRCSAPLRLLSKEQAAAVLNRAALSRFEAKARRLHARATTGGWEQAMWEGLFRCLGYKQNVWPMHRLGELRTAIQQHGGSLLECQAVLTGLSGLLPHTLESVHASAAAHVRKLWDVWWRVRESFRHLVLPRNAWRFDGLRPANQPLRRLALASHWLRDARWVSELEAWGLGRRRVSELRQLLEPGSDLFWSHHWTLRSRPMKQPCPLLGASRATDLAVNVLLPWLWARAREDRKETLMHQIRGDYLAWPAGEDNAVLRLARQRLMGTSQAALFRRAAAQQGLLQIVGDYCAHSNAICENCRFPGRVMAVGLNPV